MKRTWLIYVFAFAGLAVGMTFLLDLFPEEQKVLRGELRNTVVRAFPEQAAEVANSYGVSSASEFDDTAASVLLIHGLDDPGKV